MSCCGKVKKVNTMVTYENGVKLIYSGSKQVTFLTPSRNVYVFDGKNKRVQEVHPSDVDFLLSRYNKAFAMFRIYEEPVAEPEEILEELVSIAQTEDMGYKEDLLEELVNIEEEPVKKTRRKKKTEE